MKCLEVAPEGDAYRAGVAEVERPVPRSGEVLVRVEASGLNRADLDQIAGHYPPPAGEPEILGLELSGTVVETGEHVCALVAGGAHAEYAAVPVGQVFPAPTALALADAAAIPEAFLTAYLNLVIEGALGRGERVLVHAGASGVGLAAIQTAKLLGAAVAATTRSAAKLEGIRAAGADLAIDTAAGPFADVIEGAWGRDAIAVILDPIGADTLAGDLRVLARQGRVVFLSTLSGARAELDVGLLLAKRGRLIGSTLRSRPREEKARIITRFREEVLPGFDSDALGVSIDARFPPDRAAEAFSRMRANLNAGKILIDWS